MDGRRQQAGLAGARLVQQTLAAGKRFAGLLADVSGQVIAVLQFDGTTPFDGTLFWDMFSKDGIEVTSGLYIYVAEGNGGSQTGHFAILR